MNLSGLKEIVKAGIKKMMELWWQYIRGQLTNIGMKL
jgi:hypothetical protein